MTRDDDLMQCWCGAQGAYEDLFNDAFLDRTCGGTESLNCYCGGDLCVCHHHGSTDCPGCFEAEGFCVVRGPDLLWDQTIEEFSCASLARSRHPGGHAAATSRGPFDGIIAGPPCQNYSDANRNRDIEEGDRLLRETLRVIDEARPEWFLIENVRNVPDVALWPYFVQRLDITDDECGGMQRRLRHIQFGSLWGDVIRPLRRNARRSVTRGKAARAVLASRRRSDHDWPCRRARAQGFEALKLRSLTKAARDRAIGNGVPFAVSATLAAAVKERGPATGEDCICGCGRPVSPHGGRQAIASCRKRMERRRRTPRRIVTLAQEYEIAR